MPRQNPRALLPQLHKESSKDSIVAAVQELTSQSSDLAALVQQTQDDLVVETDARIAGDAALDARVTPLESQLGTYPSDYGDLLPAVAPPDIDTTSDIGTAGYGFAFANHTHGGAGGGGGSVVAAQVVSIPGQSITSSSFVDVTGVSLSFAQATASQKIRCDVNLTCYSSASDTVFEIYVMYDGVAQTARQFYFNPANTHLPFSFSWLFTGAASSGTKTVKVQMRRLSGSGTITFGGLGSYAGDFCELNVTGY